MINIQTQTVQNVSDCVPLYLPHSLYLKPLAKMYISVALPVSKMGKSISNLDIMDKLSSALKPDKFLVLKVSKSTVEFIRFEAELDDRSRLRTAISRLDGTTLKVSGFSESFRVRAAEPKDEFPTRHDWDSFFRDASHMDEMKAGERPDTIHLTHLPIRWFCPRHSEHEDNVKPSESIFRRIFEKFGSVRCVDIPICDPYRNKMNSDINGMKTFSFEQDVLFEAYVQFDEYVGFVRVMDEFRGMKLVRKFVDKTQAINITVNFDKTKHLSDGQLQRRERVRKRLIGKAKAEEEERDRQKKLELDNLECQRQKEEQLKLEVLEKQREREEKRKEKHLKKIQERGEVEISQKIRIEERKLMIAQRKLESIRILEQLFDRVRIKHIKQNTSNRNRDVKEESRNDLRDRLVEKYKSATEKLLNEQKKKVQDIKSNTPILGLLRNKQTRISSGEEDVDEAKKRKLIATAKDAGAAPADSLPLNPFKAVAALAAAGGVAATSAYSNEAANEWMKSLSMFPYVPQVFAGMPALYRPPAFGVSMNYRGYAPRIRSRGRGRGRGRGGYDPSQSSSYYNYKNYNYDEDGNGGSGGYYRRSSYSPRSRSAGSRYRSKRRRSRSTRSRSRSRSKSKGRRRSRSPSTRSRTRSKSKNRRRSRTRSRSRKSRARTRSKTPQRTNKKLVSTRRSRSSNYSTSSTRSRSRSKSYRSKRSWSRHGHRHSSRRVVLETDKLVRSAEEIKRTIEKDTQELMREEEREIKENFRRRKHSSSTTHLNIVDGVCHTNNIAGHADAPSNTVEAVATDSPGNSARRISTEATDRERTEKSERSRGRRISSEGEANGS